MRPGVGSDDDEMLVGGIYVGRQAQGVQFVSKVGVITGELTAKDVDLAGAKRAKASRTARIKISGTYFDTIILPSRFPARGIVAETFRVCKFDYKPFFTTRSSTNGAVPFFVDLTV